MKCCVAIQEQSVLLSSLVDTCLVSHSIHSSCTPKMFYKTWSTLEVQCSRGALHSVLGGSGSGSGHVMVIVLFSWARHFQFHSISPHPIL